MSLRVGAHVSQKLKYKSMAFGGGGLKQEVCESPRQPLRAEMYSTSKPNQNKTFVCVRKMPLRSNLQRKWFQLNL